MTTACIAYACTPETTVGTASDSNPAGLCYSAAEEATELTDREGNTSNWNGAQMLLNGTLITSDASCDYRWSGKTLTQAVVLHKDEVKDISYFTLSADGKTYTVYGAQALIYVNELIAADKSLLSCGITLGTDITLPDPAEGGSNWKPLGDSSNPYTGTFDGNGKIIQNLVINQANTKYIGLIGYLKDGQVNNLTLEGCIVTGDYCVGGIAGYIGNSSISGCTVTKEKVTGNNHVGGIAGNLYNSSISGCTVTNEKVTGNNYVGGILGFLSTYSSISGCTVTNGEVTGNNYVGGIAGYIGNSSISGCTVTKEKVTGNDNVGGIAGNLNNSSISGCFAKDITVSASSNKGGVAGYFDSACSITACFTYQCKDSDTAFAITYKNIAGCTLGNFTQCYYIPWTADGTGTLTGYKSPATEWSGEKGAMTLMNAALGTDRTYEWSGDSPDKAEIIKVK